MQITDIRDAIRQGQFRITDHADEEARDEAVLLSDVLDSVLCGEIIEDYPNDRPYPSCLVLGKARSDRPLHSVWAYNEGNGWAVLITVYRPDPARWIDWRYRRR